jgi:hypothetical protein
MKSEQEGPMSGDRPEAAAERSDDRVRTVAQPEALDSGPCELCVDQEVALNADPPRHAPPPDTCAPTRQRHADARPRADDFLCTAEARGLNFLGDVVLPCGLSQGLASAHRARRGMLVRLPRT